jgi:beta-lactamase regulating signal transducer with metallopeptidase domain
MVVLYLFCVLRIFLPIEFPKAQIVLMDKTIYTSLVEAFTVRVSDTALEPRPLAYIVVGVWCAGTIVITMYNVIKQRSFKKYIDANGDYATIEERANLSRIAVEVLGKDKSVTLKKTDAVTGAMVIGLFRKLIIIPDREYEEAELGMVFRHECTHIKNKDLWIKLLIQIYCCIFWWNPIAYLLKHDLDFSLELKCDLSATKRLTDTDKAFYLEALSRNAATDKQVNKPFMVCAELANGKKKNKLVTRIKAILAEPPQRAGQVVLNTMIAIMLLGIFVGSYVFIWQPFYGFEINDEQYMLDEGENIIDDTNSYLVLQEDGNYLLYYLDYQPMPISKDEVEQGLYEGYPILEK